MDSFKAFRIYNDDNTVAGRVVDMTLDELAPGEVVFKTAYSSVNYKDALAGTGTGGKIIRKYPLTGGIDAAGTVVTSTDSRFTPGDEVICTSYDVGVAHDGGYAEYCRVPADWVVPLPKGLTLFEAMALGKPVVTYLKPDVGARDRAPRAERPRTGERQGPRERCDRRRCDARDRHALRARIRSHRGHRERRRAWFSQESRRSRGAVSCVDRSWQQAARAPAVGRGFRFGRRRAARMADAHHAHPRPHCELR